MLAFVSCLVECEDLALDRGDVEIAEGAEFEVLEYSVSGNEFGAFGAAIGLGNDLFHVALDLKVVVPETRIDFGKDHLTVEVAGTPDGVVFAKLARVEV